MAEEQQILKYVDESGLSAASKKEISEAALKSAGHFDILRRMRSLGIPIPGVDEPLYPDDCLHLAANAKHTQQNVEESK